MVCPCIVETIGKGESVAVLFNARAKRVTADVVRSMRRALPRALVLVSEDIDQARRHCARIAELKPRLFFPAGGDGSVTRGLNLLREVTGMSVFPPVGALKLGTGNAWARISGAPDYEEALRRLPTLALPLPTRSFDLLEVEKTLCPFAGVGWEARILNDYNRNLDERSEQLLGASFATKLHKGLYGYLYSIATRTIPEEIQARSRYGQPRITLENLSDEVFTVDSHGEPVPLPRDLDGSPRVVVYEGGVSIASASITPEWGFGFRAFPHARNKPGHFNLRVYEGRVLDAVRDLSKLWVGEHPLPGMHDFFSKHMRMTFSRPMPFQIGGDGLGLREKIELRIASETVDLLDWGAALPAH